MINFYENYYVVIDIYLIWPESTLPFVWNCLCCLIGRWHILGDLIRAYSRNDQWINTVLLRIEVHFSEIWRQIEFELSYNGLGLLYRHYLVKINHSVLWLKFVSLKNYYPFPSITSGISWIKNCITSVLKPKQININFIYIFINNKIYYS